MFRPTTRPPAVIDKQAGSDFGADAAHELRTPLAIVRISAELLAKRVTTIPQWEAMGHRVLTACVGHHGHRPERRVEPTLHRDPYVWPLRIAGFVSADASRTVRHPGASGSRAPVQRPVRYAPAELSRRLSRPQSSGCAGAGAPRPRL
jgi:signal transduction histidine kinase